MPVFFIQGILPLFARLEHTSIDPSDYNGFIRGHGAGVRCRSEFKFAMCSELRSDPEEQTWTTESEAMDGVGRRKSFS